MTDQQHPITPPRGLMQQWMTEIWHEGTPVQVAQSDLHLAACAAQWGADQELEACCELLELSYDWDVSACEYLRVERRPSTSLKHQALKTLEDAPGPDYPRAMTVLDSEQHALIRRALEALSDD